MKWKNIGLVNGKNLNAEEFTTDTGIKIRRVIHPLVQAAIKIATEKPIITMFYPELEKNAPYIFAAGHYFPGEIASNLAALDRNAYVVLGTTDQIDHNPEMYIAWLNGLIYVNKLDSDSRKECFKKMKRILESGTSVLLFPEGVLNNTENLYSVPPYPGFYHLAQETNKLVVPVVSHTEVDSKYIFFGAGEPMDFSNKSKKEALIEYRDAISTLRYYLMPKEHPIIRTENEGDLHLEHMQKRKKVYDTVNWTQDVWDEEIMTYHPKGYATPQEVRASLDNVNVTAENAHILAPILVKRLEDKKYDFKQYMKDNWDK